MAWRAATWKRWRCVQESLEEDYLRYRIAPTAYLGDQIAEQGVPIVQLRAAKPSNLKPVVLASRPGRRIPGVALELYLEGGIRSVEIGNLMFARDAQMELVLLAVPRRVCTQNHIDSVVETGREPRASFELRLPLPAALQRASGANCPRS